MNEIIMSTLWNNVRYHAPIECLIDTMIRVYDIRKANISILTEKGFLSGEQYYQLYEADKMDREVFIGKLLGANPSASKALQDGIIEAKRIFFESNHLEDNDILEIDNDAVYVFGYKPVNIQQTSPLVYFKLAEVYSSFYKVKDIEYLYYFNMIANTEYLKAKGLGSATELHEPYMLDFLKTLFYTAQTQGVPEAISLLNSFYQKYMNKELDIGYYRNLNPRSLYSVGNFDKFGTYKIETDNRSLLKVLDISYNEKILRQFNILLSSRYFKGDR